MASFANIAHTAFYAGVCDTFDTLNLSLYVVTASCVWSVDNAIVFLIYESWNPKKFIDNDNNDNINIEVNIESSRLNLDFDKILKNVRASQTL
ncbi:hypothetical protein RhiirA4_479861 [Rhizophagus irregularis]|uniref:Uncharacterized protein n=1 Tax=Rhizophagus irregularis TaxID=588596 RepID=A0A2I1HH11_9GLOM|nr:hypothetical protein RhiirA4_479861 [Rhizophagus irregularis]